MRGHSAQVDQAQEGWTWRMGGIPLVVYVVECWWRFKMVLDEARTAGSFLGDNG